MITAERVREIAREHGLSVREDLPAEEALQAMLKLLEGEIEALRTGWIS